MLTYAGLSTSLRGIHDAGPGGTWQSLLPMPQKHSAGLPCVLIAGGDGESFDLGHMGAGFPVASCGSTASTEKGCIKTAHPRIVAHGPRNLHSFQGATNPTRLPATEGTRRNSPEQNSSSGRSPGVYPPPVVKRRMKITCTHWKVGAVVTTLTLCGYLFLPWQPGCRVYLATRPVSDRSSISLSPEEASRIGDYFVRNGELYLRWGKVKHAILLITYTPRHHWKTEDVQRILESNKDISPEVRAQFQNGSTPWNP